MKVHASLESTVTTPGYEHGTPKTVTRSTNEEAVQICQKGSASHVLSARYDTAVQPPASSPSQKPTPQELRCQSMYS